jgi:hypothetical protein
MANSQPVISATKANPTSLKKITANRRNALRSTGPKTSGGKRVVRMNALKHGLLAKGVVIDAGEGKEDPAEYERLLSGLIGDLGPVGTLEGLLVQQIANCYWKLRRAERHEVGLVREGLDNCTWDAVQESSRARRFDIREILKNPNTYGPRTWKPSDLDAAEYHMRKESAELFERLAAELKAEGDLSPEIISKTKTQLAPRYDDFIPNVIRYLGRLQASGQTRPNGSGDCEDIPPGLAALRQEALAEVEAQVLALRVCEALDNVAEQHRVSARFARMHLPPAEKMDGLLRYEAAIHRQLYRAMDQLERRQRLRKGDYVPPPLKINVQAGK